ncbi:MAG: helical backbone metal receptor [Ignavibacteria bacterium]|nr:helical backbone metal receptor [Ignavibacteria bacterium]
MNICFDQLGNKLSFNETPKRIVSIVPSITELLFFLGLGNKVVGVTRFCTEPKGIVEKIPKVGGTKNVNISVVESLNPDIIIANKEENEKEQVEKLRDIAPVWVSYVTNFDTSIELIEKIGLLFEKEKIARTLVDNIQKKKGIFVEKMQNSKYFRKRIIYFIWRKPYMIAGKNTFIDSMLSICTLQNVCEEIGTLSRYPTVDISILEKLNPDIIFLSTEPYPFKEKHINEFANIFPNALIKIVRGDYFSWYGSRILDAFDYFHILFELER